MSTLTDLLELEQFRPVRVAGSDIYGNVVNYMAGLGRADLEVLDGFARYLCIKHGSTSSLEWSALVLEMAGFAREGRNALLSGSADKAEHQRAIEFMFVELAGYSRMLSEVGREYVDDQYKALVEREKF